MQEYKSKSISAILDLRGENSLNSIEIVLKSLEGLEPGEVLEIMLNGILEMDIITDAIKEESDYKILGYQNCNINIHLFIEVL